MTQSCEIDETRSTDEADGCRGLISVQAAITRGVGLARVVPEVESIPVGEAMGRILAHDLKASMPLPPFDNSAMDGYALRSADLVGEGPWRLRVTGQVAAGDNAAVAGPVARGEAFHIFAGAAIPPGADAVILQEHVRRAGDAIVFDKSVARGSCIRRRGEDTARGARLLTGGTLLGAREIGAIAAIGLPRVAVRRALRVALVCAGSELRQPGEYLAPGQLYNSNRYMMRAELAAPWIDLVDMGAIINDPARLRETLLAAAGGADMVIASGGLSGGGEEYLVAQLLEAGGQAEVMKIAMKPGKPLAIGTLGGAVYLGLPGNPVAAFTTWKIIGSPIAARLSGQIPRDRPVLRVEAGESFSRRPGRQEYRPARLIDGGVGGRLRVRMLAPGFAAKVGLICQADGLVVIPAECPDIKVGQRLDFLPL